MLSTGYNDHIKNVLFAKVIGKRPLECDNDNFLWSQLMKSRLMLSTSYCGQIENVLFAIVIGKCHLGDNFYDAN